MNTTTQINTDDFATVTSLQITYDIDEFCELEEDVCCSIDNAIEEALYLTRQKNEIIFTDCHEIEICEDREIAYVNFNIASIKEMSETSLKRQLLWIVRELHSDQCTASVIEAY